MMYANHPETGSGSYPLCESTASMKLTLRWGAVVCVVLCNRAVFWTCSPSSSAEASAEAELSGEMMPPVITKEATCGDWVSWAPPKTDPAIVMQVVSKDYVDLERNFIRLMELNSGFTRENLYIMCLDDATVPIFASLGIRGVPVNKLRVRSHKDVWKTRVRAVSCLVEEGYNVIMSDSDALWLRDPMEYMDAAGVSSSSIVASRGSFPRTFGWGSTICMGFILFRATGAGMNTFQDTMENIALRTGDDQVAVNQAASDLGVIWDEGSDMRYEESTDPGKGTISDLSSDNGEPFGITLLPHSKFTRICRSTPVSNDTVVAHCFREKKAGAKLDWMQELNLWLPELDSP